MKFRTLGPKASSGCGRGDLGSSPPLLAATAWGSSRLGRGAAAVTLLAAVLTGGAALVGGAAASASTAIPPTLTGESFRTSQGTGSTSGADFTCTSFLGGSTLTFSVSGTATGPYPGTFIETGTFSTSTLNASFTITSGSTTVTGTKTLSGTPQWACQSVDIDDVACCDMSYTARIHTPTGDFLDHGTALTNATAGRSDFFTTDYGSDNFCVPPFPSARNPIPCPAGTTAAVSEDFQSALAEPVPAPICTTTITGNHSGALVVPAGSILCLSDAHQSGSIIVQRGGGLSVENSTISGSVTAYSPRVFRMCGSTTGGSVSVSGATGFVMVGDPGDDACASNTIGGALILQNNHHGLDAIGNTVKGAVTVSGNSGVGPFPSDTGPEVSGNGP